MMLFRVPVLATLFFANTSFAADNAAEAPVQVATGGAQGPSAAPPWINFVLIGGILLFMWLFVFRPQSKRAKEQKEFLASLTPGAEVVTTSGLVGTVIEVHDHIVTLNLGTTLIRVLKSSVSGKYNTEAAK